MRSLWVVIHASSLVLAGFGRPVEICAQSTLAGVVRDARTKAAVAGAEVLIAALARSARTDDSGRYVIREIDAGRHTVAVRMLGYDSLSAEVGFSGDDAVVRDFALVMRAQPLAEVPVLGKAQPVEDLPLVGADDLRGPASGEEGKGDRDQAAHDMGIRIATEMEDRIGPVALGLRHDPDLADAALDLALRRLLPLFERFEIVAEQKVQRSRDVAGGAHRGRAAGRRAEPRLGALRPRPAVLPTWIQLAARKQTPA